MPWRNCCFQFDMDLAIGFSTVELFDCLRSTDLVVHKTKSGRKKGENICRQDTASASHAAMMITNVILPNLSITSSSCTVSLGSPVVQATANLNEGV